MSDYKYSGSKVKVRENLQLQPHPAGEQSVLPPLSGKLNVDKELKLSRENFKQSIVGFFKDKALTPLSQLTATPPFPTPHLMVQFASKAYTDYKKRETDAEYEKRLALPDGWNLLTTASNSSKTNGYFGAAYWHPEHQQVVIAHRGTDLTNLGALWAGIVGVLFKHHVPQMCSASTFAQKVVEVLQAVNREKGVNFQIFYTGHSLGGWLAQITNFTTKYLKIDRNTFLKCDNASQSFHPHTVVFDSPGCQDMLSQMADEFDVRLDGRSIDLEYLDITSYLSVPNRINTCNKHVGTVYRIFPDFSDMSWLRKHTALYTLEAHSLQKIVEFFDPQEGQVHKDEQGKQNIQVVIDWPVTAGFRRGEEYKSFFKGAKHFNDYHPDITQGNYSLLRYQTKTYDERVSRLSVFCKQERQFLESYLWLRQLPGFFKPKELFSVMEDKEVQEKAEKILQSFEIGKDTIRCADGSALQAMIPYVKRLLSLFPQIKENTKCALLSNEIRNRVYQLETRRYVERINQSPLKFNSDASIFREFLESEQQKVLHLQLVDVDEWTGLIKVYQVLQKIGCLSEGQYTVLTLDRLLTVNMLMDFNTLMQSTVTPHLLLMAYDTNQLLDEEAEDIIRNLLKTIKQKPNIKILLSTPSECSTLSVLQQIGRGIFGKGFVKRHEKLTWSDITIESQETLLNKLVEFQGIKIPLYELVSAESPIANYLPLGALLEEKQLIIGDPVPISNAYNEGYYIGRTLHQHRAIKQDKLIGKYNKGFPDLIASTEQEFRQLCQNNPKQNVHWLEKDKSGKLLWQQSQGSLATLRTYIDTDGSHTYTADDLDKLLEQAQHQKVMLISDTAGMGKTTVLTHLSKQTKQKFPAKWVVRINLNDHTDALKELEKEQIDKEKAIEFISEKLLKLEPGLEKELFKQCCEQKQKVRTVIMLDGFDEISPFYKETLIGLLQALRQTAVEQLWVTTRPHLREELEDKLQQLSYTLEPFSEKDQFAFLKKFWSLQDWFMEMNSKEKEKSKKKLESFAEMLIKKLVKSISDKDRQFTGIPLQTRMLAEAFDKEVKALFQSIESKHELPLKLDLLGLYGRFIERKYDIYQEEKSRVPADNVVAIERRESDLKVMRKDHQLLALNVLFNEEQLVQFESNSQCIFSVEQLTRIGIVQVSDDGKLHFIHRTFAEYYVADYLVNRLSEGNKISQQVLAFILKDISMEVYYRVIRVFIDNLLSRCKPSKEVLKEYGNEIHGLGEYGKEVFKTAVSEGNDNIVGLLLDCVQAAGHTDTVKEILLANYSMGRIELHNVIYRNNIRVLKKLSEWTKGNLTREEINHKLILATKYNGMTVCHVAAEWNKPEILQKVWDMAEEKLTTEEIKNKLLLATDDMGRTAWHVAVEQGALEILQKLWEWAKEKLTTEEINNKLLLATDGEGRTVWHVAAERGKSEMLQKVWDWAKEKLKTEEINNKLLLATDGEGRTVCHVAAEWGTPEILQDVWECAKEKLTTEEINNKLLLATDNMGRTFWYLAAERGTPEIFQKVWNIAEEKLTTEEINNKLLLATDYKGSTVWHAAAEWGQLEILQKIWVLAKEKLTTEEINNKLLLATNNKGETVWHVAAEWGKPKILQNVWDWAKERLTTEEIKNKLLLATDYKGSTVWHVATKGGRSEILQKVWEWAKEKLTTDEINNKLILATDNMGRTVWHVAAEQGTPELLQNLWECAKKKLTTKEVNNKLFLAKDGEGRTICHVAAKRGKSEILQKVWEWTKEKLTTEEINNKLLLATDNMGRTVWHVAAERGTPELLQKVWEWAKEKLTKQEINNNLLLAADSKGRTVWHVAAKWGKSEILQKVWEWAKEKLTTEEINNKLLLVTDNMGRTVWHVAAEKGTPDVLQKVWDCAKEKLTTEEISNKLLLATDNMGRTVWHVAAEKGNPDVLQKVWDCAKEKLTTEEISNKLLLATDYMGKTVWHVAAGWLRPELLQKLWDLAEEARITEEMYSKLLLATDNKGRTISHCAAEICNLQALQLIWELAIKELTTGEIKNMLLLATDREGRTVLQVAAELGTPEMLQKLREWAEEVGITEETYNKLLLATDN